VLNHCPYYTATQFVGLNMFTESQVDGYYGLQNVTEDLDARVHLLQDVLKTLRSSSSWEQNLCTLKIFMVPEFFFRGKTGAYDANVLARFGFDDRLQSLCASKSWSAWLFVLGTVVVAHKNSFFNLAPIIVGGKSGSQAWHVAIKHNMDPSDFIPVTSANSYSIRDVCKTRPCFYNTTVEHLQAIGVFTNFNILRDPILKLRNLRIGVEICLDHPYGLLCRGRGHHVSVNVQLILSASQSISWGPVCVPRGGSVYLIDGRAHSEVNQNEFGLGHQCNRRCNVGHTWWNNALSLPSTQVWSTFRLPSLRWFLGNTQCTKSANSPISAIVPALKSVWTSSFQELFMTSPFKDLDDVMQGYASGESLVRAQPVIDVYWPLPVVHVDPR
jgi:hypothetical protein